MTKTIKVVDFIIIVSVIVTLVALFVPILYKSSQRHNGAVFAYGDTVSINGKLGKITGYKVIKTETHTVKLYTIDVNGQIIESVASDIIFVHAK